MTISTINLARKWRSVQFDQLIGQDLSVRVLKNSLFSKQFFPVYLFAGHRGCGKTTTARIFAAALNCEKLSQFQQQPQKTQLPCLVCNSCIAMQQQRHPDFIEIDAASHTGVDNVRSIIDAASLLPVLSLHKIYLIDEAHMLSKAAFNALLKILEEPPRNVFFILATTDASKILETVKSRCFSLFFYPVGAPELITHLAEICTKEKIEIEQDAISMIVQATGGLVRDAINLLEQVRFAAPIVTKKTVLAVLGHLDDEQIIMLVDTIIRKESADLLKLIVQLKLTEYTPMHIWESLLECLRALVWQKHGISSPRFTYRQKAIHKLAQNSMLSQLEEIISFLYDHQEPFKKTTAQHNYLEFLFLRIIRKNHSATEGSACPALITTGFEHDQESEILDEGEEVEDNEVYQEKATFSLEAVWKQFLESIKNSVDQMLYSIFSQAQIKEYLLVQEAKKIEQLMHVPVLDFSPVMVMVVLLPIGYKFYYELFTINQSHWQKSLNTIFKNSVQLAILFSEKDIKLVPKQYEEKQIITESVKKNNMIKNHQSLTSPEMLPRMSNSNSKWSPDLLPPELWTKTHMLLAKFPGTITSVKAQQ